MAEAISSTPFGPLTAEAIQSMSMQQYAEHRSRLLGAATAGGLFGFTPPPTAEERLQTKLRALARTRGITVEDVVWLCQMCEKAGLPALAWWWKR